MRKILDKAKRRAEAAEVIEVVFGATSVLFRAGRLKSMERREGYGVGLRVISQGRIGFSSTTDSSRIEELVDNALVSARRGQTAAFQFPASSQTVSLRTQDEAIISLSPQRAIEELERASEAVKSEDDCIHLDGEIRQSTRSVRMMNSAGLNVDFAKTEFDFTLIGMIVEERGILQIVEGVHSGRLRLETDRLTEGLLEKAKLARRICPVSTTKLPVIFVPPVLPELLMAIKLGVSGKMVQKGSSPLTDRMGEKLADARISLYDDGTLDFHRGSKPFDGEGVGVRRTPVIEGGILKNYLFDLQTAGVLGADSTGSAQREYSSLPWPGFNNVVMDPGDKTISEMIGELDEGLVVHQIIGGGLSNLLAGDFSLNVDLGFKVERGEIAGRVKNTMVAGNVYEALSGIRAIGHRQEEWGNFFVPAIAFEGLEVSSTDEN